MTDLTVFRVYEPFECGTDGYPEVWHRNGGHLKGEPRHPEDVIHHALDNAIDEALAAGAEHLDFSMGVKHIVRALAGHRCQRCRHPFVVGKTGQVERAEMADAVALDVAEPARPELTWGTLADPDQVPAEVRAAVVHGPNVHWSPCDELCDHGGPARARVATDRPWQVRKDATADEVRLALANRSEVHAAWRILTVHHLNGVKADLRWWNLAALCQRCHLHIQKKVVMERVYPFEHTDWFKPHAAAWYGYAYLGLNLTREHTMERLDELLALERMA